MEQVNSPKTRIAGSGLLERVRNMLFNPNREWDLISIEKPDNSRIIIGYVLPLAGLAALAALIGYGLIGISIWGARAYGITWGIYYACRVLIGAIITVYLAALVIDNLAPSFSSEKNFGRSLQLAAYSFTPVWVGGLLAIIPVLGVIGGILGLYGLYLMYVGIPKLKHTPEDKHVAYFVISLLVTMVVYMVIGWVIRLIFFDIFALGYHVTLY